MKLEEQVLTIEQAKHLQQLGLNMSDAAFAWFTNRHTKESHLDRYIDRKHSVYTYTLQEALNKLPKEIVKDGKTYYFYIEYPNNEEYEIGYSFGFDSNGVTIFEEKFFLAVYKLLCWVTENGYLEDEK